MDTLLTQLREFNEPMADAIEEEPTRQMILDCITDNNRAVEDFTEEEFPRAHAARIFDLLMAIVTERRLK